MNNKIIFLTSIPVLLAFIFIGCIKQNSLSISEIKKEITEPIKQTRAKKKVIIRARWHGFTHQYPICEGGDCGICAGFCVKVVPRETSATTLSPEEITAGDIFAWMYISTEGGLCMEPEGNIDNGNGTTSITENFDLGDEIATMFGLNSISILAGVYTIEYSEEYPNGRVCFEIDTE
jgi:hypothetical protein